jgi:bifunctional non-homologous end joining protein LigD
MSLREYKKKRDFGITAEPAGREKTSAKGRSFVVQKHDASRLHYDFRLEMAGVLKSWAVPKGFSAERGERRLAVHVEDHPLDYADFEGIIPQGQYGGGTVMVWDFGNYEAEGDPEEGLRKGKLQVALSGKKLKGEWTLVHSSHQGDEKNWFLIKTGASIRAISKKAEEHSALTGRTMGQIAEQKAAVWQSGKKSRGHAVKVEWVEPMKATLTKAPPTDGIWSYELKWDGYRALALKHGDEVELISRNQKALTGDFPELRDALAKLPAESALIDGEICALDSEGRPSFQLLQGREMGQSRPALYFYAFDLLQLEADNLMPLPLEERKEALRQLLEGAADALRYSAPIEGKVETLLAKVRKLGLEGLIGKRSGSPYRTGVRSSDWIKLKVSNEQELVVGGVSPPKGTRKHLGALLVGYYEGKTLHFAGKVGTGFNDAWLTKLAGLGKKLHIEKCPFADMSRAGRGRWGQGMTAAELRNCAWWKPELVAQIRFAEWTDQGLLRQPVFLGLREDKPAGEVRREVAR